MDIESGIRRIEELAERWEKRLASREFTPDEQRLLVAGGLCAAAGMWLGIAWAEPLLPLLVLAALAGAAWAWQRYFAPEPQVEEEPVELDARQAPWLARMTSGGSGSSRPAGTKEAPAQEGGGGPGSVATLEAPGEQGEPLFELPEALRTPFEGLHEKPPVLGETLPVQEVPPPPRESVEGLEAREEPETLGVAVEEASRTPESPAGTGLLQVAYEVREVLAGTEVLLRVSPSFLEASDFAFEHIEEFNPERVEIVRARGDERETVWVYDRSEAAPEGSRELVNVFGYPVSRWTGPPPHGPGQRR